MENARLDAEILVAHGLGIARLELYLRFNRPVDEAQRGRIRELLRERARLVPVAYLTGEREFCSLAFHVEPGVLVPRPETEHLVEIALPVLAAAPAPVFADVGTGSGCIAIALLHQVPAARAHATDVSARALAVAGGNAHRHGVADRLALHEGDLLAPLRGTEDFGRLEVVVSNPPYVVRTDPTVEAGVRAHEPPEALFVPGEDPLEVARRVAEEALEALRPGGALLLEVGFGSGPPARALLEALGYVDVRGVDDLASIERVVGGRTPSA